MTRRVEHLVLYDGVCGLCNGLVHFLLKRDRRDRFRFAALQSPTAAELLRRFGRDPQHLDTVYVLANHGQPAERLLGKGRAIAFVLEELGGVWNWVRIVKHLPAGVLNAAYRVVATRRYHWFGRYERCPLPDPKHRTKFIDAE